MTVIRQCPLQLQPPNPDLTRVVNESLIRTARRCEINFGTQFANPPMLPGMMRFGLELDWAVAAALFVACSLNGALLYGLH